MPEGPTSNPPHPHGVAFTVLPKGMVHSPLHRGVRIPGSRRTRGEGVLEIFPQYIDDFSGLKVDSRAWVLTYRAGTKFEKCGAARGALPGIREVLKKPDLRWNHPIRIDQVTIRRIDRFMLQVEGLEAEDGSPILEIQPVREEQGAPQPWANPSKK